MENIEPKSIEPTIVGAIQSQIATGPPHLKIAVTVEAVSASPLIMKFGHSKSGLKKQVSDIKKSGTEYDTVNGA